MTQNFSEALDEKSAWQISVSSENPSDFIHFETLRMFENALLGGLDRSVAPGRESDKSFLEYGPIPLNAFSFPSFAIDILDCRK